MAALAWQRYAPALAAYLRDRGVAGQDLDDVCADAFLSMLESWATFDGQPFRGWLYTLARDSLRSHARARRGSRLDPAGRTDWPDPSVTPPEQACDARVALATIQATLASLSEPDRLIALCMALGESDIATVTRLREELGITMSTGTLGSRRSRLRRVLANTLCARGLR